MIDFIAQARKAGVTLSTDELLGCLLVAALRGV